jgi:hypothetical protein
MSGPRSAQDLQRCAVSVEVLTDFPLLINVVNQKGAGVNNLVSSNVLRLTIVTLAF